MGMQNNIYRDGDALSFDGSSRGTERNTNHIAKRKKVDKGQDVVFNDDHRKEYLTGFRKRKLQRRKDALKRMESKAKKSQLEQRAERRQQFKHDLGLPDNYGVDNSSDDEADVGVAAEGAEGSKAPGDVKVYDFGNVTTTVTMVALDSDQEVVAEGGLDGSDSDEDADDGMALPKASIGPVPKLSGKKTASKRDKNEAKKMEGLRARIAGKKMKSKKPQPKQEGGKKGKKGKGAKKGKH